MSFNTRWDHSNSILSYKLCLCRQQYGAVHAVELGDFALAGECSCLTIDLTRGWFPRQNYCCNVHIELIPPVTIITKGNLQFANMRWIDYSCRGRDSFSKTIQARTGVQVIMVHKLAQTYLLHTLPQVETS